MSSRHMGDGSIAVSPLEALFGLEPEEILPKLREGDPLNIQEACVHILQDEASLIDPSRMFEHALIEVAFDASICTIDDLHPDWLDNSIRRALSRILTRDRREEERGIPEQPEDFEYVRALFWRGEDPCRIGSIRYHALPAWMRRAFYALLMRDMPPQEAIEKGYGTKEQLRHACWSVFVAVGVVTEKEYAEFRRKKGYE